MNLNFADIVLTIRAADPSALRSWLAGGAARFAVLCKEILCNDRQANCANCCNRDECQWMTVFGQELAVDPEALRLHQKPSLPFVFSFVSAKKGSSPAEPGLTCRLVIVGRALTALVMLLEGFARLLAESPFPEAAIMELGSRDFQGKVSALGKDISRWNASNLVVLSAAGIMESRAWDMTACEIHLLSPLRLLSHGSHLTRFDFAIFVRSLLRRISSLAYYYDTEIDDDFKDLSRQAETISCTESNFRYGRTSFDNSKASGITGWGSFSGDFDRLLPYLVLGSYFHTGKSASFGYGDFALE